MYVHDLIRSISISVHSYLGIRLLPMISNIVLKFSKNLYINLHKIKLLRIGIRKLVSKIGIVLVFKWWKEFPILQFCIWKFPWYDSIIRYHISDHFLRLVAVFIFRSINHRFVEKIVHSSRNEAEWFWRSVNRIVPVISTVIDAPLQPYQVNRICDCIVYNPNPIVSLLA